MKYIILITVLITTITGCATTQPNEEQKDTLAIINGYVDTANLAEVERVSSFRFGGWTVLDSHYLILEKRLNQYVLVKLATRCSELKFANVLGLDRIDNNSLYSRFDSVFVPDEIHRKCPIESMYEISKEQRKAIIELLAE